MKRGLCALAAALLLLGMPAVRAQTLTVYVSAEAMPQETARQLGALLARELAPDGVELLLEQETGETLRARVLRDDAPQLAICAPQEVQLWAKEGLLAAMEAPDAQRMQRQVLDACSLEGELFMAPLLARHRTMAVNRRMLEAEQLGEMLDTRAHPVWYPLEMQQVLDAFAVGGGPALELWPLQAGTCAGVQALAQAMYSGAFLSEDGQVCQAESGAAIAGVEWIAEMLDGGLIGWAESREEALGRFLSGETAIFIDWTDADERENRAFIRERGLELATLAYPSASGLPVRSFDVVGAAVFLTGDAQTDALAKQAAAFLGEDVQAQLILGDRGLWADGAVWLPCLSAHPQGALLRAALCQAFDAALTQGMSAEAALRSVTAALSAAK